MAAMAVQQELADLSAEVKELRREASSIANATEQTLDELLQHMEALQKVQADARDARSQTLRGPKPWRPWHSWPQLQDECWPTAAAPGAWRV